MATALRSTDLKFPVPFEKYAGKVRDTYRVGEELMVLVASDRISAFDVILPRAIPYKGQVLNQTAAYFLEATKDIAPNHLLLAPDPNVMIGKACKPFMVEVVVRGHLCGHAWRVYRDGGRELCGITLPEGLKQNDAFPEPLVTPSTKSLIGHDEDISEREIMRSGLVDADDWGLIKHYALELFRKGQEMAREKGLILADTKYEFGLYEGETIMLIDEVHTPDSSRYFYADGFEERQEKGESQKQLSKEFVREWLIENGFQGQDGQEVPEMPDELVNEITNRYIEVYETVTGLTFEKGNTENIEQRIESNVHNALEGLGLKVAE